MSTSTGISLTPAPYWPNVYTTGVPIGTTLTVAGSNTINAPGTYDSLDFTGFVTIAASNVTLTNSRIRAIASDPWSLEVNGTQTNVLVKNVTIIGASNATTTGGATYGFYVSGNSGATFDACNISHVVQNAINNGNVLVKNCYIHYDQAIAPVYQVIHTNNYDWITGVAIP